MDWTELTGEAKGATYDTGWEQLAAAGRSVHGEADLVWDLLAPRRRRAPATPPRVLDAGCGTGRVAIELARRGIETLGVDRDADLLTTARAKAPELGWIRADLLDVGHLLPRRSLDLALLAGNVLIFVDPGTEAAIVGEVAGVVRPGGLLVTGFQVRPGGYDPATFDRDAARRGLHLRDRWSTWDRSPWVDGGDYQVSVHVVGATPRR